MALDRREPGNRPRKRTEKHGMAVGSEELGRFSTRLFDRFWENFYRARGKPNATRECYVSVWNYRTAKSSLRRFWYRLYFWHCIVQIYCTLGISHVCSVICCFYFYSYYILDRCLRRLHQCRSRIFRIFHSLNLWYDQKFSDGIVCLDLTKISRWWRVL